MSALHQDWTDMWAPALMDETLRGALIGNARFATRIEFDLLDELTDCETDVAALEQSDPEVALLMAQLEDETLLRAGLYWSAPALATSLQPLAGLPDVTPTRARLRLVMAGRDHSAASQVETPRSAADLHRAGRACLAVWLRYQPDVLAARLRVRLAVDEANTLTDSLADGPRYSAMCAALETPSEDLQ